jgi:hypothetical protein
MDDSFLVCDLRIVVDSSIYAAYGGFIIVLNLRFGWGSTGCGRCRGRRHFARGSLADFVLAAIKGYIDA